MDYSALILDNWHVKFVALTLIVAAWIDGKQLRVPNWITYPMVLSGLIYNLAIGGWDGLGEASWGMTVGLLTLLPLYAIGGMGAGDVKLMAGIGAWLKAEITVRAFIVSAIVGAVMALAMVIYRRSWTKHYSQFLMIFHEVMVIKNPRVLSERAAERKPSMLLLPYGIPICVGSIAYFLYTDLM